MDAKCKKAIQDGAQIIDVRSPNEFSQGHPQGSLNIPVGELEANLHKLDKTKTLIVCCASGGRSAMAKVLLESKGFKDIIDAGAWKNLT